MPVDGSQPWLGGAATPNAPPASAARTRRRPGGTWEVTWTLVRSRWLAARNWRASGATLDRDGLQRALRDARAGLYDVLLVYRLDRLTRSIRGLLDIIDTLNDAGVALVSASEHFDPHTPVGRMVMQILAVFAEFERPIIIDRVVAGMERKPPKAAGPSAHHPSATPSKSARTARRPAS